MRFDNVVSLALDEMAERSKKAIYQTDFQAWKADVLGFRTYEKMQEIWDTALFGDVSRTFIKSANGTAKDLALDTPLLTTSGWKTMATVQVGDHVFSEEGLPIRVSWKSEVFHKPSYKVTFDDGAYLVTSDTHQWNTLNLNTRSHIKAVDWRNHWDSSATVTTADISDTLKNRSVLNHLVPLTRPVVFPEADLKLPPYVLGAWLGDGTAMRAEVTCNYEVDGYVIDRIRDAGYCLRKREGTDYSFVAELSGPVEHGGQSSDLYRELKSLGVINNKHIPEKYLYGSADQRIDLIQGLMDTDGTANKSGSSVSWSHPDLDLVGQFCDLLVGLGVRFTIQPWAPPVGKTSYRVEFNPWFDPFTPGERKSHIYQLSSPAQRSRLTGRTVVSVKEVTSVPTQCIQVDSERHLYLAGSYLVPTHNSFEMASAIAWVGSVFPPGDAISIISAPSVSQIEKVIFSYLKSNYSVALRRHELKIPNAQKLPGWISEDLQWKFETSGGNKLLAFGKKPADQSAVSIFQGVRSETGYTYVFFDEAGGMARGMYTAAEAVMTGGKSRFVGIGNPDNAGTEFQQYFTDQKYDGEVNRFTLSAFDLPTLTGERVYPKTSDGDVMEAKMLQALTQESWVEHKKRIWGEKDARYLAKVLGEFPGDGDNAFFGQRALDVAYDTDIADDSAIRPILGVDIARFGQDESVVYSNQGGRLRLEDSWGKQDTVYTSSRIHDIATRLGASQVRIDSAGIGGAVFDQLSVLPEFQGKSYQLIGIDGGTSSPDVSRWANLRAYNHDSLRTQMVEGSVDLDYEDMDLREQILGVTYKFNNRGAIQITPKDEMRTVMDGSPDRLDALIYAAVDMSWLLDNPLNQMERGDRVVMDPYEMIEQSWGYGAPGVPL